MGKDNNEIFELHNYLNTNSSSELVVEEIVKNIPDLEDIGFAGCLEKDWLKTLLKGFILDKNSDNQHYSYNPEYEKKVREICEETLKQCKGYINKKIHIFLFPTFSKFVIEKMGGVNGFSSWHGTLWIFVNFVRGWEDSLKETIVHELAHAVSPFYKGGDFVIGYGLILDGIAEHFKDYIIPNKRSSWTQAISEKKAWEMFRELKDSLTIKDFDKYNELFYGTGKYPLWAGYTIGYYLVKEYLKKQRYIDWNGLLRKNPKDILKEIEHQ